MRKSTKKSMEEQGYAVSDRRLHSLTYTHDGEKYHDVVGRVSRSVGEEVFVILDAGNVFVVCTGLPGKPGSAPGHSRDGGQALGYPRN